MVSQAFIIIIKQHLLCSYITFSNSANFLLPTSALSHQMFIRNHCAATWAGKTHNCVQFSTSLATDSVSLPSAPFCPKQSLLLLLSHVFPRRYSFVINWCQLVPCLCDVCDCGGGIILDENPDSLGKTLNPLECFKLLFNTYVTWLTNMSLFFKDKSSVWDGNENCKYLH